MDEKSRTKWGYTFQWTESHLSPEEINPLRYQFDELGTAVLERLQAISARDKTTDESKSNGKHGRLDFFALLRDHHQEDHVLSKFWQEIDSVPEWVDWDQIARGQDVFYRYAVANLNGFALQGFVQENSAVPGVLEVLIRTGSFSPKVLLRRLLETFQWLLQITHSLSSIQPGGEGHESTVRIRLLHASVRQRMLKLVQTRPDYFDVNKFGVPVNTLDSIHSIAMLCCDPTWFQLPKMGIMLRKQETEDYIALFRYVAYLLATPNQYFETVERAKAVMESMYLHELDPTGTPKVVAHNFVTCLADLPPFNISREFLEADSRWMNGDELCDALQMGKAGWYHYALMTGFCWNVRTLALVQRTIPRFDRFMINYFRQLLYQSIILSKSGLGGPTAFDFKHLPQIGKTTPASPQQGPGKEGRAPRRIAETFLLASFLVGCVLQAVSIMAVIKLGMLMRHRFFAGMWALESHSGDGVLSKLLLS